MNMNSLVGGNWTFSIIILLTQVFRFHFLGMLSISFPWEEDSKLLFSTRYLEFDFFY